MSRRALQQEPGFGSDSFLDIIANVVGILIILVVLAGLRASQSLEIEKESVAKTTSPDVETVEGIEPVVVDAGDNPSANIVAIDQVPADVDPPQADVPDPLPELPQPQPRQLASAADIARLDSIQKQIGRLNRTLAVQHDQPDKHDLERARQNRERLKQRLALLQAARTKSLAEQKALEKQTASDDAGLANLKRRLDQVNDQLMAIINQRPQSEQLNHRITPVGRVVDGPELHFRLSKNRVSQVPIQELIDEVKEKIQSNGVWLSKFNRHQGQAGPVDGYKLKYSVERVAVNSVGAGRGGGTMIRLSVSEFSIEPVAGLREESVDDALAIGGSIVKAIQENPPNITLTVWVYPDSFGSYREIATFAQRNGIRIAGRPLPKGMPISGSPNGSQSIGQ
jgi:hypothetical protein